MLEVIDDGDMDDWVKVRQSSSLLTLTGVQYSQCDVWDERRRDAVSHMVLLTNSRQRCIGAWRVGKSWCSSAECRSLRRLKRFNVGRKPAILSA